jgi:threonine/homoserine/homoserine lactone efflux protein
MAVSYFSSFKMLDTHSFLTFSLAAFILIIIPGPAVLFVIARSIEQGRLAGIVSVLGISVGAMVHATSAAVGISAIFAASAVAFSAVKYLGAAYLIYLGISTLLAKTVATGKIKVEQKPLKQIFRQGIIVNILNPKAALFFLAFLPQFADPARGSVTVQILLLGLIFVAIALLSDSMYALLAGQLREWLGKSERFQKGQKYVSGMTYIALGLVAAVSGKTR